MTNKKEDKTFAVYITDREPTADDKLTTDIGINWMQSNADKGTLTILGSYKSADTEGGTRFETLAEVKDIKNQQTSTMFKTPEGLMIRVDMIKLPEILKDNTDIVEFASTKDITQLSELGSEMLGTLKKLSDSELKSFCTFTNIRYAPSVVKKQKGRRVISIS